MVRLGSSVSLVSAVLFFRQSNLSINQVSTNGATSDTVKIPLVGLM